VISPLLAQVLLRKCGSLAELSLSSGTFRIMKLDTCTWLQRLELTAPHLHALDLAGCGGGHTGRRRGGKRQGPGGAL